MCTKMIRAVPTMAVVILGLTMLTMGQTFNPISYKLPPPPALSTVLSPNYALYNAEKVQNGRIRGSSSFAFLGGNVYALSNDEVVVNVATCQPRVVASFRPQGCRTIAQCGYLTSIREDKSMPGMLLVLDAYRGVYRLNPANGGIQQLYTSATPVAGRSPVFLSGMTQAPNGLIFLSDASDKFNAYNDIYIIMEGRPSGRVLALNPTTKTMTEVVKNGFVYPNGLEVTPDGTKLLIAESGRARVLSLGLTSNTWLQIGIFSNNLPGMPENIRRSSRGTYWVGLSRVRHSGIFNSMDTYSDKPRARSLTVRTVNQRTIRSYYPRYGMVVELDASGRIMGSLHDPSGQAFSSVSEAAEHEGLLYFGSPLTNYVGRIVLPQGDGRVVTVDSVIQVLRSRCQIPEERLEQARRVLAEYIRRHTQGPATTTPTPTTQPATTQPPTTQPATTQPPTTQPATTQPSTTQPSTTQSSTQSTTQASTTQSSTAQTPTTQSGTQSTTTQSQMTQSTTQASSTATQSTTATSTTSQATTP